MMKDGDQPATSVYMENNFKPPDRSTSAPPVLSLHSESLFAFRAAEHLQLFSDIRCEDNYYEFYNKYQGGKGLPPPLETQPFLMERPYAEEDDHILNNTPHTPTHQQQIQQLQQQIQQQQQQLQQQQAIQQHLQLQQQQYMQQNHTPSQMHSPHHGSHQQHLPPHAHQQQQQHMHSQQHPHSQHSQQQHMHHQQGHHHQQHPMHQSHHLPSHQQQQMHQSYQMHQQPHPVRGQERSYSVPDARNPLPRSTSNPSYSMRPSFDSVQEESHDDDIWTPHPKGMVVGLTDHYLDDDAGIAGMPHAAASRARHHSLPHRSAPLTQQALRDPSNYYNNEDFDNVALRSANQLLQEDNLGIGGKSIWNDRAFETRAQQMHGQQGHKQSPHITAPTPTIPSSQSALMELLSNGLFPAPTADAMLRNNMNNNRRRSHSGGMASIPPLVTTPPLLNSGSASTSPALPICRYYAQGFCSRGERCNFLHDEQSQQALASLQQNSGNDQFTVTKPKAKKSVSSPPPMSMSNMPPKVPSPVNNNIRLSAQGAHAGNGHHANGLGNGVPSNSSNATLNSIINSLNTMNLAPGSSGRLSPTNGMLGLSDIMSGSGPSTSPQPIPRSTTPNSNGLADAFANGGSTSPNGKSDLTRQYTSIEQVIGHIYSLCKDQHGCRFLQKKLEDRDSMIVEIIFNEVYDHMTELMIDPFGNYLCQKLLEHCNDEQRLDIIEKVAPDLVKISKNMHGTRAVQKMIEYLTTPEQITIAKKALSNHVVTLIQDLNGNHVIQRCLNRLSPQDNQFIYDSVSQAGHCVEVATHRHGCCVLQRCIDHASDSQKIQLINEIIANALVLVQDPYGNYVVQYLLDLPFPGLASRLARRFLGHIPILSTQKFSSNVVEKCLNVTDIQTRAAIIQELVEYDNLLYLLQDPYANYVIQTSLNVSEPVQHARLVEAIRPHLTSLRNTPYGKRIQNKILKESSRDYYA